MAQKTTQAVMQVQAEVIAGSHVEESFNPDISGQLNDPESEDKILRFGEYSMTVPDGSMMTVSVKEYIHMNNGSTEFAIKARVEGRVTKEGKIVYSLSGFTEKENIQPGRYEGEQWTTIEYH